MQFNSKKLTCHGILYFEQICFEHDVNRKSKYVMSNAILTILVEDTIKVIQQRGTDRITILTLCLVCCLIFFTENIWGKFHQPYGAKRKCAGIIILCTIQFHQQDYAKIY